MHRQPPEDKDTALRFMVFLALTLGSVAGLWALAWALVAP